MNWKEFKGIFNDKYFLVAYVKEKRVEFLYLEHKRLQLLNMRENSQNWRNTILILIADEGES